jgi:hypothetical protein
VNALALGALVASVLGVQEPPLRPVSEYLTSADSSTTPYVARRCSALLSLVGERWARRGDAGTAQMYAGWSIGFEVVAAKTDEEVGNGADQARLNRSALDHIKEIVKERMDRSIDLGADPLLSSDLQTCRDLVDRLHL